MECTKCGKEISLKINEFLCLECLIKEFKSMENGNPSGYLTVSKLYYELKKSGLSFK